ncbi:MAG: type II secretion system protein [Bacillota bacterium]
MKKLTNKGWTLVEMITVLAIIAIVMLFSAGILFSSNNIFASTTTVNEVKMIGDNTYNWISEKIIYTSHLQIVEDTGVAVPVEKEAIYIDSNVNSPTFGRLLYKKSGESNFVDFFGGEFYNYTVLSMKVRGYNNYIVDLSIYVMDKSGNSLYDTGSTMEMLNLRLNKISIKDINGTNIDMSDDVLNPLLIFDYNMSADDSEL